MSDLATWKCHKIVKAGKILPVQIVNDDGEGTSIVTVEDRNGAPCAIAVRGGFFARGMPGVGDYLVIYEDGYKSWSPAKALEDWYGRQDGTAA
jgi:hypothetical protein